MAEDLKIGAKVKVSVTFNPERRIWHANRMILLPKVNQSVKPQPRPKEVHLMEQFYARRAVIKIDEKGMFVTFLFAFDQQTTEMSTYIPIR